MIIPAKVFTWVNGSDPDFQQQLQATIDNNTEAKTHKDDLKPQRFEGTNLFISALKVYFAKLTVQLTHEVELNKFLYCRFSLTLGGRK